jgi:hypothetical protein
VDAGHRPAADIGNGRANLPFERLQQCYCFLGLLSHQVAGGIDTLGQAGQGGTKSIMEIAAQPATLFLPGRDQSFARTLKIDGQLDGVDGRTYLDGQILQEPRIRFRERIIPLAWMTYQYSDLLVLREQGYLDKRALFVLSTVGGCGPECLPILERDSNIGQLESLGDGFNDARQDIPRDDHRLDALSQARDDDIGVISLAIEKSVDGTLQAHTQRAEEQGDHADGQWSHERIVLLREETAQSRHDDYIRQQRGRPS